MLTPLSLLDRSQLETIILRGARSHDEPEADAPRCSDVAITQYLPAGTGPRDRRLRHVLAAAHELLTRIAADAMRGRSLIEHPQALKEYFAVHFAGAQRESFVVVFLDATQRVIACEELFAGTLSETHVHPREVVRKVLEHNAAAVAFGHPHPSGCPEPSRADERLTLLLKSALALIDVRVIDHIVVGVGTTCSFAERGLL